MNSTKRQLQLLSVLGLLFAGAGCVNCLKKGQEDGIRDATPTKHTKYKALLENTLLTRLADDKKEPLKSYIGKSGLLIMFAQTTCDLCEETMGDIGSVVKRMEDQGVRSVIIDLAEARAAVHEFYVPYDLGIPILYEEADATTAAWEVDSVPTILVFDKKAKLVYRGPPLWRDVATTTARALGIDVGLLTIESTGTEHG